MISIPVVACESYLRSSDANLRKSYQIRYGEVFENHAKADIIVLGSSHSAHGIVPSCLELSGGKVYNFSFNYAGPIFNSELFGYVLANHAKPKLIIYAVDWFMFDKSSLGRNMSNDYRYMPLKPYLNSFTNNPLAALYAKLYITHESNLLKAVCDSSNTSINSSLLIGQYDNGFMPFNRQFSNSNTVVGAVNSDDAKISAFKSLLLKLKQNNINVLFVQVPEYLPSTHTGNMSTNNSLIRKIATANGIQFLNYNEALKSNFNYDTKCFSDITHLNYFGALRFSKMLSKDINNICNYSA